MKIFKIALILFLLLATAVNAAEITKTFAWDTPADMDIITKWELHWGNTAGGPYVKLTDIIKVAGQTVFEAPATVDISGPAATTQTRYFVLKACGDIPQAGGGTVYECSGNSNETDFSVWIPANGCEVPVNFRVKAE